MGEHEAKEMLSRELIDFFALRVDGVSEDYLNVTRKLRSNNFKELADNAFENGEYTLTGRFFLNQHGGKWYSFSIKLEEIEGENNG